MVDLNKYLKESGNLWNQPERTHMPYLLIHNDFHSLSYVKINLQSLER